MVAGHQTTGWCPRGRRAEDGRIPDRYRLRETESAVYAERTRRNVADADATLILAPELLGGTAYTVEVASALGKPLYVADPQRTEPADVVQWIRQVRIQDLNVAGPRESEVPGIYEHAHAFMRAVLSQL
jgi:hypothetical protein